MHKQTNSIPTLELNWYHSRAPLLGCLVHSDIETGAVIRGDVVVISYRCEKCGKATAVEHIL